MQVLVASVCTSAGLHLRKNEKACPSYCTCANKAIRAHCCEMCVVKAGVVKPVNERLIPTAGSMTRQVEMRMSLSAGQKKELRALHSMSRLNWSLVVFSLTQGPHSVFFMLSDPDPVRSRTTQDVFVFSRPSETQRLTFNFKPMRTLRENRVCLFM